MSDSGSGRVLRRLRRSLFGRFIEADLVDFRMRAYPIGILEIHVYIEGDVDADEECEEAEVARDFFEVVGDLIIDFPV